MSKNAARKPGRKSPPKTADAQTVQEALPGVDAPESPTSHDDAYAPEHDSASPENGDLAVTEETAEPAQALDAASPEENAIDAPDADASDADASEALPSGHETSAASADGPNTVEDDNVEAARPLAREHLRGLLEALVFASDKPMSSKELSNLASASLKLVKEVLAELRISYARRGIVLDEVAGGWLFRTHVQFAPFVRELTSERPIRLSRAQVETLAIAAYRQPITRPEIDEIRGVDSGATLKLLLERDLVRILGKKDEPGRPLLYGTTTHFLEFFGLKSLKDLPTLREFTELSDESRRVAEAELGSFVTEPVRTPPEGAAPPQQPEPREAEAPAAQDFSLEEARDDAATHNDGKAREDAETHTLDLDPSIDDEELAPNSDATGD